MSCVSPGDRPLPRRAQGRIIGQSSGIRKPMSAPKIEQIAAPSIVGEGPHWDQDAQALYYVDVKKSTVNKYVPATKKHTTVKVDGSSVSLVIPVEKSKDKFVIGLECNVAIMTWDGESRKPTDVKLLCSVDNEKGNENNRLNDGKVDPSGRLWAGTMGSEIGSSTEYPPEVGSLYSFSKDWKVTKHFSKITISNGLAWSEDQKKMYFIDTLTRKVEGFDMDASGNISNRHTVFDFNLKGVEGLPDGMTIDTEGKLWVACIRGSQVIRVDPTTGELLKAVKLPAWQITSCTFGGANLDELYVTSANFHLDEETLKKYPLSGSTFRITGLGVKGHPGQSVKV